MVINNGYEFNDRSEVREYMKWQQFKKIAKHMYMKKFNIQDTTLYCIIETIPQRRTSVYKAHVFYLTKNMLLNIHQGMIELDSE
jgi:hypothetical protein